MVKSTRHVVRTADDINNKVLRPILSMSRNDTPDAANWNVPTTMHAVLGLMVAPDSLNSVGEYCITPPAPDNLWIRTRPKDTIKTFAK